MVTASVLATGASLAEWLVPYGIHCESRSSQEVLLTDDGLEVRWYLSVVANSVHVSRAERAGSQNLEMIARDLVDAERFLVYEYGRGLRGVLMRDAPRLQIPYQPGDMAPGFEVVASPSGPLAAVLREGGQVRAQFSSLERPTDAVAFSHIANYSVGEIKDAFMHPTGAPIFTTKGTGPVTA